MPNLSDKISSLLSKTGKLFQKNDKSNRKNSVSHSAKLIFERRTKVKTDNYIPPYRQIAEQLNDSADQVFESAVYHLAKIAVASCRYRKPIVKLLEQQTQKHDQTTARCDYIKAKLEMIKQSTTDLDNKKAV